MGVLLAVTANMSIESSNSRIIKIGNACVSASAKLSSTRLKLSKSRSRDDSLHLKSALPQTQPVVVSLLDSDSESDSESRLHDGFKSLPAASLLGCPESSTDGSRLR